MPTNDETVQGGSPADEMLKVMAAQSAAMVFEDLRAFLQGGEQILLVALAKYLEKSMGAGAGDTNTAANVDAITGALSCLSTYAASITQSANTMTGGCHPAPVVPAPEVQTAEAPADAKVVPAPSAPAPKSKGFFANLMF